jgi:maltose O-acetyltransferase
MKIGTLTNLLVVFLGWPLEKMLMIAELYRDRKNCRRANVHPTARVHNCHLDRNVTIGEHTYVRGGVIASGQNSKVVIGRYCALGRNISIRARTHDLKSPTAGPGYNQLRKEADIIIGDYVWIGNNVYIREGVRIDSYAVIGANSVVVSDVKPFEIVAGIPARVIRLNTKHHCYQTYFADSNSR